MEQHSSATVTATPPRRTVSDGEQEQLDDVAVAAPVAWRVSAVHPTAPIPFSLLVTDNEAADAADALQDTPPATVQDVQDLIDLLHEQL